MGARFWVLGVIGAGIAVGLGSASSGCGSSSSGGQTTDGGDDSSDATPCNQQAVSYPDAGECNACITMMCSTQLSACTQDCMCGMQVNSGAMCLANLPEAGGVGGGLAGLLFGDAGGAGGGGYLLQFGTCILAATGGGGGAGGGLLGGGTAGGGGGAPMSTAALDYLTCLGMTCGTACGFTPPDGGVDAAPDTGAVDGGSNESSTGDSGGTDSGSTDASNTDSGGATDAASDGSTDDGASDGGAG